MVTARRRGRGPKTGEGSKVGGTCNSLPQPSGNPRDGIVRVVFPPGMLLTSAAAAGGADDFLTRQVTRLGSSRAPRGATRSGRRCVGYPPHGARAVLGPDYFEIRLPPTCAQQTAAGRGVAVARVGTRRRARAGRARRRGAGGASMWAARRRRSNSVTRHARNRWAPASCDPRMPILEFLRVKLLRRVFPTVQGRGELLEAGGACARAPRAAKAADGTRRGACCSGCSGAGACGCGREGGRDAGLGVPARKGPARCCGGGELEAG